MKTEKEIIKEVEKFAENEKKIIIKIRRVVIGMTIGVGIISLLILLTLIYLIYLIFLNYC